MPLYKRKPGGVWWCRIGRKTRKTTGTRDRKRAEEFEQVEKDRLWRRNKLGDRGAISWEKASERWLKISKRSRVRDREFLAWLEPKIGNEAVRDIADPEVLDKLREWGLAKEWSPSTVDRMMRTVRSVLRSCWKRKEIDQPYVPMHGDPEPEPRFLTAAQFKGLCAELPQHLNLAARFAVLTLLRKTPQARLTWDRVDIDAKWAWVPGEKTKTGKPFGISLSDEAIEILQECKRLWPTGERVFRYEGEPVANFHTAAFKKAARRAGVLPLRWHDMRHTGASWAVQSGVTLQELMVLGNWKSYKSVLVYAHLAPSNSTAAARAVGTSVAHALKKQA